jgi:hypothetical protein
VTSIRPKEDKPSPPILFPYHKETKEVFLPPEPLKPSVFIQMTGLILLGMLYAFLLYILAGLVRFVLSLL